MSDPGDTAPTTTALVEIAEVARGAEGDAGDAGDDSALAARCEALLPQLTTLLQDAVASGASLGFWDPLGDEQAHAYWRGVFAGVVAGERRLLVAQRADGADGADGAGAVLGSAQLAFTLRPNAIRRAEVQKVLVLRAARRQGIGRALMLALERLARADGRTLLTLDTLTGSDAERLYATLGFQRVGVIPGWTLEADGTEGATTFYYKSLTPLAEG